MTCRSCASPKSRALSLRVEITRLGCRELARKRQWIPAGFGNKSVVLRAWLDANQIASAAEVERFFVTLHKLIAVKDEVLTIGHSYFMLPEAASDKRFTKDLLGHCGGYHSLQLIFDKLP